MSDKPQNEYLKAKIMTASPEQLQMMLYDGAIRFCEQARQAIEANDIPTTHDRLLRAQRIVMELTNGLKNEVNPQLCSKLAGLYNYVYRLLVDANFHRKIEPLDEAMKLLRYQRDTWQMVVEKVRQEKALQAGASASPEEPTVEAAPQPSASVTRPASSRPVPAAAGKPLGGTLCLEG